MFAADTEGFPWVPKITHDLCSEQFVNRRGPRPGDDVPSVFANRIFQTCKSLDKKNEEMALKYCDESKPIPKPEYWGGYRVIPSTFEFWYGHRHGLPDRLRFRRPRSGEV